MRDIRENILPATLLQSDDHVGAGQNSDSVDMQGFNACAFFMEVGTITGTGSVTPKLQESDDDSAWTDVPNRSLVADNYEDGIPALESGVNARFGYAGNKRYVRVVTTVEGTVTASTYNVLSVQGEPTRTPTEF